MQQQNRDLVVYEQDNRLIISERRNEVLVKIMDITAGAVTKVQLAYYEANLRGRIKQLEADLILKYFYGLE